MEINKFSLVLLTLFIISSLCWLFLTTLKEGKEAIKQLRKDSK